METAVPAYTNDQLTLDHLEKLAERFSMSTQDAAKFMLWSRQKPWLADKPIQQRIAKFREQHPLVWPEH
ncbi:MAG TPA: hypothetical protein PK231_07325 [Acidocella sp.]|nr:hypothetical protein [Acidocella sp.]